MKMSNTNATHPSLLTALIVVVTAAFCYAAYLRPDLIRISMPSLNPHHQAAVLSSLATPTFTTIPTFTDSPIVDVPSILGTSVNAVEATLGKSTYKDLSTDPADNIPGGLYRYYQVGKYSIYVAYDSKEVARAFGVLDGLSDENYSISDWKILLHRFGLNVAESPAREVPTAAYWDNYGGYYVAVAASSSSRIPVWTVRIAQAEYGHD